MTDISVVPIDRLELPFAPRPWAFADERRGEIDAYFAKLRRDKPELWNGRVLLLREFNVADRVFRGSFFETDFASFLAWRDWGFPDPTVKNCFAMGALRGADGGFVLGEMAAHTANARELYFPAGTPDPEDVVGDTVDLAASVMREVCEETGLTFADFAPEPGWFAVLAGPRAALMKLLQAGMTAAELRERILGFLASQRQPELSAIHIVRGPADLSPAVPPFVASYLRHVWSRG